MADTSTEMDGLTKEVGEIGTVVDSAVAAFNGLAEQIRVAAGDRAKSLALATELDAKAAALAAAIPAGTPAEGGGTGETV